MLLEFGACNVNNQVIQANIARIGRIKTEGTMEGTNNKIKGCKGIINMGKVTIEVLHLDKTYRMRARKNIIMHVVGGMLKINVGWMVRILVVTTVEVITLQRNVGNRIVVATG